MKRCAECGARFPDTEPSLVSREHEESCSLHPDNVVVPRSPNLEISQAEVIERLARALVEEVDKAGPKDLKHAQMLLEVHMNDFSVRASRRRLYRALAEILGEEARS